MDAAALIISIVSVTIALSSLGYSVFAIRREQADRREELDLLRHQVEGDAEDRRAQRRAEVAAVRGGISWGDPFTEHEFHLVNAGPANARAVRYWAARQGHRVIAESGFPVLLPGESHTIRLQVPRQMQQGPLALVVAWEDGEGEHEDELAEIRTQP